MEQERRGVQQSINWCKCRKPQGNHGLDLIASGDDRPTIVGDENTNDHNARTDIFVGIMALATDDIDSQLLAAVKQGNAEEIHRLLLRGANVNTADPGGWTPLHYAAIQNACKCAEILIECGANLDALTKLQKSTPEQIEEFNGNDEISAMLNELSHNSRRNHRRRFDSFQNLVVETSHRAGEKGIVEK